MSEKPPEGPGWGDSPGGPSDQTSPNSIAHESERERIERLRAELPQLLEEMGQDRGRAQLFYPFILIRSVVGDRGDRPIDRLLVSEESPDIWIAEGDPSVTPAIPPDHGRILNFFQPHTVYAHVWNLGRAPIAGVKVEFYRFQANMEINDASVNLIGMTRVDLGPRSSPYCHKLVKCPKPWHISIVVENLVVRASAIGDGLSDLHPWDASGDRHVAQRNIRGVAIEVGRNFFRL